MTSSMMRRPHPIVFVGVSPPSFSSSCLCVEDDDIRQPQEDHRTTAGYPRGECLPRRRSVRSSTTDDIFS